MWKATIPLSVWQIGRPGRPRLWKPWKYWKNWKTQGKIGKLLENIGKIGKLKVFQYFQYFGDFATAWGLPCKQTNLGLPEQRLIDLLLISIQNWKKEALRSPRAVLLCFNSIVIENERPSLWGSSWQILIDLQLNSNCKWKEICLRQPRADSDWFLIEFYLKMTGNWSEAAQGRFWLIFN